MTSCPYVQIGKGKVVKVTGIHNKGRTATCLLRGSNKLVLEEAERSLHDALCVVRCLVHKKFLIAGGAAPEVELVTQLSKWAKTLQASLVYMTLHLSAAVTPWNNVVYLAQLAPVLLHAPGCVEVTSVSWQWYCG